MQYVIQWAIDILNDKRVHKGFWTLELFCVEITLLIMTIHEDSHE